MSGKSNFFDAQERGILHKQGVSRNPAPHLISQRAKISIVCYKEVLLVQQQQEF